MGRPEGCRVSDVVLSIAGWSSTRPRSLLLTSQTILQAEQVRPATRRLYAKAVAEFEVWAAHFCRQVSDQFVDTTLNAYMLDLFFRGESPYAARVVLYGPIHMQ